MKSSRVLSAVLLTTLATASGAAAQSAVHFGALGGATFSSVSFSPQPLFDTNSRTVASAGAFLAYELSDTFSVDARLMWVEKSVELSTSLPGADSGRTSMSYLTLPVLFKARLGSSSLRPYLLAGPEFQLRRGEARTTYRLLGVEQTVADFDRQFRSWDVALDIGAGLEIPAGPVTVLLEGLYSHGLHNIVRSDRSDFDAIKTSSLRLSVGLRF